MPEKSEEIEQIEPAFDLFTMMLDAQRKLFESMTAELMAYPFALVDVTPYGLGRLWYDLCMGKKK